MNEYASALAHPAGGSIARADPVPTVAWIALAVALAIIAFAFAAPLLTLTRPIALSYNEGWNAYFASRAMNPAAGLLYPAPTAMISNNYPPLSFFVTGAVALLTGDQIVAGRLVSLAALLATSVLAGVVARLLGAERRWAVATGVTLLVYASALYPQYNAMDDPQWLAQATMLAGLAVLLRSGVGGIGGRRFSGVAVVAAAALMAAALLVKHNVLGQPAAIAAWLLLFDRRALVIWGTALAAIMAISLAAITARFGSNFVADVLQHHRVFSNAIMLRKMPSLLRLVPLTLIGVMLAVSGWRRPATVFALLFAVAAFGCAFIQRGGEGVNYNAHFEALTALAIVGGIALSHVVRSRVIIGGRRVGPVMLLALIALPLAVTAPKIAARETLALTTIEARDAASRRFEARIAATPGRVGCELLAYCYWAGKPFEWDFFNYAQRLRTGTPVAPLADTIRNHGFAAIALTRQPGFAASDGERLPKPLPTLIEAYYRPSLTAPDDNVLMVPRKQETGS